MRDKISKITIGLGRLFVKGVLEFTVQGGSRMMAATDMLWSEVRREFPVLSQVNYLDNASNGLVPCRLKKAYDQHFAQFTEPAHVLSGSPALTQLQNQACARSTVAELIGCSPQQICLTESTSHAMQIVSQLVSVRPDENVIISDQEFLGSTIPWTIKAQNERFKIRHIKSDNGAVKALDILNFVDDTTRVVVVSSVCEVTGYRVDLEVLSRELQSRNIILVVDAIQHIGALPLDVSAVPVDFLCCGGHKWLMNPWGTGFLYIRKDWVERTSPLTRGYFNLQEPAGGWYTYLADPSRTPFEDWQFIEHASKFEAAGTGNSLGSRMLNEVINWMIDIGLEGIYSRIQAHSSIIIDSLQRLSRVDVYDFGANRSPIVTFHATINLEKEAVLAETMQRRGVKVAHRYLSGVGGIRVSPHFYNNQEDLLSFVETLETVLRELGV